MNEFTRDQIARADDYTRRILGDQVAYFSIQLPWGVEDQVKPYEITEIRPVSVGGLSRLFSNTPVPNSIVTINRHGGERQVPVMETPNQLLAKINEANHSHHAGLSARDMVQSRIYQFLEEKATGIRGIIPAFVMGSAPQDYEMLEKWLPNAGEPVALPAYVLPKVPSDEEVTKRVLASLDPQDVRAQGLREDVEDGYQISAESLVMST